MSEMGRSPSDIAVGKALSEMRALMAQGDLVGAWTAVGRLADGGPLGRDAGGVAFELGRRLLKHGDPDHAQEAFRAAYASSDPHVSAAAAVRLGQAAQRDGDLDGARAYYEHAVEHGSDSRVAVAAFHLGVLAQAEDPAAAESWYSRALEVGNDWGVTAGAAANLGTIRHAAGDLDSARALFQQALDTADEKTATDFAYGIGDLLRRRGALADAEPMLRRALAAGHPRARLALARLLVAAGKLDQAESVLREAVDDNGDLAALVALGEVLVRRVDPGADLASLFGHGDPAAFVRDYAGHLPAGPEIAEAEQCYRRAIAAGENSGLVPLGHLLMGTARIAEAELVLRRAVRAEASDAEAVLAALLHLRGEDEEAARVLEPALAADNLRALMLRADLDGHRDDSVHAVGVLRRALRLGGASLGAGGMLFLHLAFLADPSGAEETLQQMLAANDGVGLSLLASFVSDDAALTDALRQARNNDEADVRCFAALAAQTLSGPDQ